MTRIAALFLALCAAVSAFADEPKLTPLKPAATAAEPGSLAAAMSGDATCPSFTNDCEICTRTDAGAQCSTPGLACQPKAWRCDQPNSQ